MKKCILAGTFDPFTLGHEYVLQKSLDIFDEVVVALCINKDKTPYFSLEKRLEFIQAVCKKYKGVKVVYHDGLLVDLLKKENTVYTVRGIRNKEDYIYESDMNEKNLALYDKTVSVFIPCPKEYKNISSTLAREKIASYDHLDGILPKEIISLLNKK